MTQHQGWYSCTLDHNRVLQETVPGGIMNQLLRLRPSLMEIGVLACVLYKIETMKGHTEIQALGGVERCIRAVGRIRTRQERD